MKFALDDADPHKRRFYAPRMATFGANTVGEFLRRQAGYTVKTGPISSDAPRSSPRERDTSHLRLENSSIY